MKFIWNSSADEDRLDFGLIQSEVDSLLEGEIRANISIPLNKSRGRCEINGTLPDGRRVCIEYVEDSGTIRIQTVEVNVQKH